jgi:NAD(P)-dependent dehydrogenase (short-subunit alcohol dehydrogenase family)
MPGFTLTPLVKRNIPADELEYNSRGTLLRRLADPMEIARPIVFLASDAASYMTATAVEVSGGRAVTLNPSFAYDRKEKQGYVDRL